MVEPAGSTDRPHAAAADTRFPEFLCPSNSNRRHVSGPLVTGWLTNYKAMGATHIESLSVASPQPRVPLYAPEGPGRHPDGALFPEADISLPAFGKDGTAHTVLAAETADPEYGVWTLGAECTLVGLPSEQPNSDGDPIPLEFDEEAKQEFGYWAPVGYSGHFDDDAAPEIRRLKTYLGFDFARADPGPYVGLDPRNTFGPSSGHPGVVNHLMVDGAVRSFSKRIDFCIYMFLITRNGGDRAGPDCFTL